MTKDALVLVSVEGGMFKLEPADKGRLIIAVQSYMPAETINSNMDRACVTAIRDYLNEWLEM